MNKKMIIVVLLVIAVVAVVELKNKKLVPSCTSGCPGGICTLPIPSGRPLSEDVRAAQPPKKNALPRLVELGSQGCIPCKMMVPILDEMKVTFAGRLDVEHVDVQKDGGAAAKYGIQTLPTQIFFDVDGKELFRHEGFFAREEILAKWKELGYDLTGEP